MSTLNHDYTIMSVQKLDRNFFQRLFGICATKKPAGKNGWKAGNGKITVDLSAMPELSSRGTAVRLEGPAKGPLHVYQVEQSGDVLIIKP